MLQKLIITVFILIFIGCQSQSLDKLQKELDTISKQWVPDKRVGICNFQLKNGVNGQPVLTGETLFPESKEEAIKFLKRESVAFIDSVDVLPDSTKSDKTWGIISLSIANMRSKPAHSAELVSQAIMGTPVKVLKSDNGWLLIQTPDRYIAWTNPTSVQLLNTSELNNWKESNRIIYTKSSGTIYAEESLDEVMSDLVAGAIVTEKSRNKTISEVELPDGRTGFLDNTNWVNFKQMKDTSNLIGDRLISTGKQFMGFPYLWGGFSSKGMDCSGFVKTVYFLNGEILQRDASQQYNYGDTIDVSTGYENLKKGDLLFFGSKEPLRITHVGMYIGDSEFIHSSGSVHINSLNKERKNFNPDLLSALVGARRIIGDSSNRGFSPIKQHQWY